MEELLNNIRNLCKKQNNLTETEFKIVLDHKLYDGQPKTKAVQCYSLCFIKESNIYKDNAPNTKYLQTILPIFINNKQKALDDIDKCLKTTGQDDCERGYNFIHCLVKETGLYM